MHQGNVQLVCQSCSACGFGPVQPRTDRTYDRFARETVVEAIWVCPRCGSRFAAGIIERIADEQKS